MCLKSSNKPDDRLLWSCGYQDEGKLRVWDFLDNCLLNETDNDYLKKGDTVYNMNMITFSHEAEQKDFVAEEDYSRSRLKLSSEHSCFSRNKLHCSCEL